MFKRRNKLQDTLDQGGTLSLQAADGVLRRTFDASVINSFRYMATELTLNADLPRRIAITSALSGEGVTYTVLALATTLANDTNARICVVELNWWAPGLIAQLDPAIFAPQKKRRKKGDPPVEPALSGHPGVSRVLAGEATLDEALIRSDRPNLHLLPAGSLPLERRPVIARSSALRELLDKLSENYDHLLLDIPAIGTTSDAIVLASLSDACIMVVRQGVTSTPSVQRALDDVKHMPMLGVVLNKVSISTPGWIRALVPQE